MCAGLGAAAQMPPLRFSSIFSPSPKTYGIDCQLAHYKCQGNRPPYLLVDGRVVLATVVRIVLRPVPLKVPQWAEVQRSVIVGYKQEERVVLFPTVERASRARVTDPRRDATRSDAVHEGARDSAEFQLQMPPPSTFGVRATDPLVPVFLLDG